MTTPSDEPVPQTALGLPVVRGTVVGMSHHKVGFDDRAAQIEHAADDERGGPMTSVMPPSDPDRASQKSLTELALERTRPYGEAET